MSSTCSFVISPTHVCENKNLVYYIMTAFRQSPAGKFRGKSSNKKRVTSRKYMRRGRTMRVGKYKRRGRTARGGKYKRRGRTARRWQSGGDDLDDMRETIASGNYSIKIFQYQPDTTIQEIQLNCLRQLTCPNPTIIDTLDGPQQMAMSELLRRAQAVGMSEGEQVDAIRITQNVNGERISAIVTVDMLLTGFVVIPRCPAGVPCANTRPVLWMMASPPTTHPVLPNGFSLDSENTVLTYEQENPTDGSDPLMLTWPDRGNRPAIRAATMDRDPIDDLVTSMSAMRLKKTK